MAVGSTGTTLGGRLTFGGVATGLDTNALIQTLLAVEARPLLRMENDLDDAKAAQKKYQELNTKLLELRNKARSLDNRNSTLGAASVDEELLEFEASSTNTNVLDVSATGDAVPGSYDVAVGQLASVGREFSTGQASQDTALGFGAGESLTIDYGGTDDIVVSVGTGSSLQSIRDAINNDANNGGNVQASVLYDGTDYHLIIAGAETGADNDLTVTESAGLAGFIDPAAKTPAQDSIIQVLGFTIQRPGNEITDVLEGVTLNLRGVSDGIDPLTPTDFSSASLTEIEIETDVTAIGDKLREFATVYNEARDLIEDNSGFDPETRRGEIFAGDSTARIIDQILSTTLVQQFTFTQSTAFQGLAEIGISFDSNGHISVDDEVLEEALIQDTSAVKRLLGGDPNAADPNDPDGVAGESGVMTALADVLEPITRSGDGTLAVRDDTFDTRIDSLEDRIDSFERLLEGREEALIRRFTALEVSVAALQAQQDFLFRVG
ncbi:MAG: flagellar filament capping protein FliD [Myxococcales bacterium]|nr:flagellar filament capping protein FliD [Myxococcales bacterium]